MRKEKKEQVEDWKGRGLDEGQKVKSKGLQWQGTMKEGEKW